MAQNGSTMSTLSHDVIAFGLALEVDKAATPGGFWTPATIFGDRLIERLTAHAGLTFELLPDAQR
jgi:short subunit dehydrogenase-like uncharacterized protein